MDYVVTKLAEWDVCDYYFMKIGGCIMIWAKVVYGLAYFYFIRRNLTV